MAVISPHLGKERETAQLLLELASNPRDVQTRTDGGLVFEVPDELYDRYINRATPEVTGKRRGPGRPPKEKSALFTTPPDEI